MSAWHSLVVIKAGHSHSAVEYTIVQNCSKHNNKKEKKSESEKGFLIFALILEKIGYHYQMVTINSMTGKSPFACSRMRQNQQRMR